MTITVELTSEIDKLPRLIGGLVAGACGASGAANFELKLSEVGA